ncbi:MAG TPA: hypothetical protein VD997_06220 [Phycisphaerales bacterium]|nr:hypothetical protein [Phycisphaerales bacterium]
MTHSLMRHTLTTLAAIALAALTACSKPYVRPYDWRSEQAAVETLAARAESIRSIQAACALTLTDPRGETVNFDGALVFELKDNQPRLRLRTWKLGQAVFDATVREDGVWLMTSEQAAQRMPADGLQRARPEQIAQAISLLTGDFFRDPRLVLTTTPELTATRPIDSGTIVATIDRATLTVIKYSIRDEHNRERQALHLDTYRELGPNATPFPLRIRAVGEHGSAEVRLQDVELNGPIQPAAFTPPRRAVKQ